MNRVKNHGLLVCLVLVLSAGFLSGCSGTPSEALIHKAFSHEIQSQSLGKIKLVNFRKLNGARDDVVYRVEFEAKIEFLANGAWSGGSAMDLSPSFQFSSQEVAGNSLSQFTASILGVRNVRKGQQELIKGVFTFVKTEKGWRAQDGQIY